MSFFRVREITETTAIPRVTLLVWVIVLVTVINWYTRKVILGISKNGTAIARRLVSILQPSPLMEPALNERNSCIGFFFQK